MINKPDQLSSRLRLLFFIGIGVALLLTVYYLRTVLGPFFLAVVIAYILDPVVRKMETWRIGRDFSIVVILLGVLLFVILILTNLIPFLLEEIQGLIRNFPVYLENLRKLLVSWTGMMPDTDLYGVIQTGMNYLQEKLKLDTAKIIQPLPGIVAKILSNTIALFTWIFSLLIVPLFSFYLLHDLKKIKAQVISYFPADYRESWVSFLKEIDQVLSGFIHGQLTVCTILAVSYTLGYLVIGIDYALLIGIFSGYAFIVPYIGSITGAVLALVLSLTTFGFDYHLALVAGWLILVQMVESYFITPRVVGKKVGLTVIEVILAVLVSGKIFGLLGVIIAVPLGASFKVILKKLLAAYKNSRLFSAAPEKK
ncbi:MAG: AI-2E family transporter [Proteobacteria bacterium]|nr:AI-2E family transporter [Pseudomonadota bacterium]